MISRLALAVLLAGLLAAFTDIAPVRAADPSALVATAIDKLGSAKKLSGIATLSVALFLPADVRLGLECAQA